MLKEKLMPQSLVHLAEPAAIDQLIFGLPAPHLLGRKDRQTADIGVCRGAVKQIHPKTSFYSGSHCYVLNCAAKVEGRDGTGIADCHKYIANCPEQAKKSLQTAAAGREPAAYKIAKKSLFIEFFVRDELVAKRTKACYCPNAEVVLRHDIGN